MRTSRLARIALGVLAGPMVLVLFFLWRLSAGPIRLAFLDQPIATAIAGLAPGLTVEIGATGLVRSGWGVALEVSGLRLRARDGTPILSLPELSLRPSLGALVRGRLVIARVDVADAALALTRRADDVWLLGTGEGGAGVAMLGLFGTPAGSGNGTQRLPRIGLTRTRVSVDDQRTGRKIALANGHLLLSPRAGHLEVTLSAALHLESAVPPVRGVLDLPIRAEASVLLSDQGTLGAVDFTLAGDAGELTPAGDTGAPLALADLEAAGHYDPDVETLRFSRLAATVGTSRVEAKTSVVLGATPLFVLDGTVDALAMTALVRLWPADLATAVRSWLLARVREGVLRRCRVQLGLPGAATSVPGVNGSAPAGTAPSVDVACDFDGVTADYLAPLDPVRAAMGSARLTATQLTVDVRAGEVGACRVEGGKLVMNLAVDPPRAEITADVSGAGADVLALVDRPPLELVAPLGITPKDLGGGSRVHAELRLPIKAGLRGAEVAVKATAALTAASLPPLVGGIGIKDGTLDVRIDGRTFEVSGKTEVTGLPAVSTPVTLALSVAPGPGAGNQSVTFALDGEGLSTRGTASLAGTSVTALAVERLRLGRNDLAGTLRRRPAGDYEATLSGASLDLETLLANPDLAAGSGAALAAGYALTLRLGSVRMSPDLEIRNLRGAVQGAGGRIGTLALSGSLAPSGDFQVTLDDARRVRITSDQAGRLLYALHGLQQVVGGRLTLDAHTDSRGPQEFLEGELVLDDFKVVRAPVLAKVLGIGSLSGIAALVQGEGLPVSEARVPFRWEAGRFTVHDLRAIGAVGLTADGAIDRTAGTCDVRGDVIPAYSLNTALGRVPLIGPFLLGGKGGGVFGIDYHVTGKLPDPEVRVNPLTSVAPTLLRSWFVDPFTRGSRPATSAPRRHR